MLKKLFPRSEFSKNIITLTSGTAIAQAIPFLTTPLLSRIYTPLEFGVFAAFMSGVLVLAVLATGRYEMALLLPEKKEDTINLLALSSGLVVAFCLLLLLLIPFLKDRLLDWSGGHEVIDWIYLYPLAIAVMAFNQILSFWNNRKKNYKRLSFNKINQSSFTAGFKLVSGLVKVNAFGLIMGNIVGFLTSTGLFIYRFLKEDMALLKLVNWPSMKEQARRYVKFPKYDMSSGVLNTFSSQVPIMMLALYFPVTVVGWYSIAHNVLRLPMIFIGSSIGQVFFQHSSELKTDPDRLRETTYNLFRKLMYLGILPMAVIGGFGDLIFRIFLGEDWVVAGIYAQLLSPWLLVVFIASPISFLLNVTEKQQVNLLFNVLIIIARVAVVVIGGIYLKDSLLTVGLFGAVSFIFWLVFSFYLLHLAGVKRSRYMLFTFSFLAIGTSFIVLLRFLVNNFL